MQRCYNDKYYDTRVMFLTIDKAHDETFFSTRVIITSLQNKFILLRFHFWYMQQIMYMILYAMACVEYY